MPFDVIEYMDRALNVFDVDPPERKVTKFREDEETKAQAARKFKKDISYKAPTSTEDTTLDKRALADKLSLKILNSQGNTEREPQYD